MPPGFVSMLKQAAFLRIGIVSPGRLHPQVNGQAVSEMQSVRSWLACSSQALMRPRSGKAGQR